MAINITIERLVNQHLEGQKFGTPAEVVKWLGAVQSQDYAGGKWAVAQRTNGLTDADIERAFNEGVILRTHVMRPTWHFVTAEDIRWMLELTAPRVHALLAYSYRKLELDDATFAQSKAALVKALQGGNQITRAEAIMVLEQAGIAMGTGDLQRFNHLIIHAELDGIVCSGGRQGKQFTYALLDERAPQARTIERDEALAELARRYFTSHGPATLKDYVWWSGLTVADAKASLDMVKSQLVEETVEDQTYWIAASAQADMSQTAHLLPNYDEYLVGYTDRSALFDEAHRGQLDSRGNVLFNHTIVIGGRILGTWKRTFKKDRAVLTTTRFVEFSAAQEQVFADAVKRYSDYLGMQVTGN